MTPNTLSELKQKYLDLLSHHYDSPEKLATEIINLESILELPKGTEHFVSDLHGEYDSFQHVLRNGSGNVRAKINDIFKDKLTTKEINDLAALVYYPEEKLKLIKNEFNSRGQLNLWYITTIERLMNLLHTVLLNIHVQNCGKLYRRNMSTLLKNYCTKAMNLITKNLIMKHS